MFDDGDEHANTYLHTYLHLLRYMYLLAQLRELLGTYTCTYTSSIDWNSPRPELYKSKTYKVINNLYEYSYLVPDLTLPYLTLLVHT